MDQILKVLKELIPYTSNVSSKLYYFLLAAIFVMVLHILFPRRRIIKFIPGIVLVLYALKLLILNGESSIIRTNVNDLETAIICGSVGLVSIIYASMIGIIYGKNKKRNKKGRGKKPIPKNGKTDEGEKLESVPVDKN